MMKAPDRDRDDGVYLRCRLFVCWLVVAEIGWMEVRWITSQFREPFSPLWRWRNSRLKTLSRSAASLSLPPSLTLSSSPLPSFLPPSLSLSFSPSIHPSISRVLKKPDSFLWKEDEFSCSLSCWIWPWLLQRGNHVVSDYVWIGSDCILWRQWNSLS